MSRMHRLSFTLEFPAGIAPGDGGDFNSLIIARNGTKQPLLRGTSLAGALRAAWRCHVRSINEDSLKDQVERFFGRAVSEAEVDEGVDSRLQVADCVLDVGGQPVNTRTHHLRNRHLGTVADGGLFSLEACPPGTTARVVLWLSDDQQNSNDSVRFLRTVVALLSDGMTLGGKAARGVGLARLRGDAIHRQYDLDQLEDHAAFLDEHRQWRMTHALPTTGEKWTGDLPTTTRALRVTATLVIPRGQDLLVGDGRGVDVEMEPQRIVGADGKRYWRLPGSSLRGLFKAWMTRLAAREGRLVADSAALQQRRSDPTQSTRKSEEYNGANLGWCFLPEADRHGDSARTDCPIAFLFGSLFQASRIHIADAFSPCSPLRDGRHAEEQLRMHVAVDRITGGAAESMLFSNTVLTSAGPHSPSFEVAIVIHEPAEHEVRWLAKSLRALDRGILRVGSSKGSGRLSLAMPPSAVGRSHEAFLSVWNARAEVKP